MILSLCILKSTLFLNLLIFTYVTFGVPIRRFITTEACHNIVRGLVFPRLHYANSLLFGGRETELTHLQRLQKKVARLVVA